VTVSVFLCSVFSDLHITSSCYPFPSSSTRDLFINVFPSSSFPPNVGPLFTYFSKSPPTLLSSFISFLRNPCLFWAIERSSAFLFMHLSFPAGPSRLVGLPPFQLLHPHLSHTKAFPFSLSFFSFIFFFL